VLIGVTGLPGACKTLWTLSRLFKQFDGRQIYVHNITGIDHEHFGTLPLDDADKWYELPHGAVIVMDEAQGVFPLRIAGSRVPDKCSMFETHRHRGHDVVLITQDATLLDVHLRKLMGKHYHCKRLFGSETSTIFEYNKFEPKPEDANTAKKAISTETYSFDKSIYEHYHSSEMHTVKRKIPFKLLMVPVIIVAAIIMVFIAVSQLMTLFDTSPEAAASEGSAPGSGEPISQASPINPNTPENYVALHKPVITGLPWTAPLYADVQPVVTFPKPHCIIIKNARGTEVCRCYTQQITKLSVDRNVCFDLARNGWFDATREDDRDTGSKAAPQESTEPVSRPMLRSAVQASVVR